MHAHNLNHSKNDYNLNRGNHVYNLIDGNDVYFIQYESQQGYFLQFESVSHGKKGCM